MLHPPREQLPARTLAVLSGTASAGAVSSYSIAALTGESLACDSKGGFEFIIRGNWVAGHSESFHYVLPTINGLDGGTVISGVWLFQTENVDGTVALANGVTAWQSSSGIATYNTANDGPFVCVLRCRHPRAADGRLQRFEIEMQYYKGAASANTIRARCFQCWLNRLGSVEIVDMGFKSGLAMAIFAGGATWELRRFI